MNHFEAFLSAMKADAALVHRPENLRWIAGYTGDVLIIHGLNDKTVPYSYAVEAIATAYGEASSQLLLITGKKSAHGFEIIYDEGREIAENAGVAFAQAHLD